MKSLGTVALFIVAIACSIFLTLHFVQYNRYQLIFEEVLHVTKSPSKDEPDLINVITDNRRVLLKFDRLTGRVWQHVDSFYYDPNIIRSAHGFVELEEDYQMYRTSSRKTTQTVSTKELFPIAEPGQSRKPTLEEYLRLVPDETSEPQNGLEDLIQKKEK